MDIPVIQERIVMDYKGKITTAGTSEGIRFDKNLFKQHPEFKQKAEVRAFVIARGTMLVTLADNSTESENDEDPIVAAFLAFIEKDMAENLNSISPLSSDQINRARELTSQITVTDSELD